MELWEEVFRNFSGHWLIQLKLTRIPLLGLYNYRISQSVVHTEE